MYFGNSYSNNCDAPGYCVYASGIMYPFKGP